MNVKELIKELNKVKDKTKKVYIWDSRNKKKNNFYSKFCVVDYSKFCVVRGDCVDITIKES